MSAVATESVTSNREEADDYHSVVATLGGGWRVIGCKDQIQWILQRQCGTRHGRARFEGRRFHRSRGPLIRSVRELVGPIDPKAEAVLAGLPDMFGGRA